LAPSPEERRSHDQRRPPPQRHVARHPDLGFGVLSFAPNILIGIVYSRRTHAVSLGRAFVLGHLLIAWNYVGHFPARRGLARMVKGRTSWDKTSRTREPVEPVASVASP
jgi:hypothetical protein